MLHWTKISEPYRKQYEAGYLESCLQSMEWEKLPHEGKSFSMPMMQGMAINEAIRQLKLSTNRVLAVSVHPGEVLGIWARYKQGEVKIYILDEGCECVILGSEPLFQEEESAVCG